MSTQLSYKGQLVGHTGWVTCLATSSKSSDILISGSRDKNLIVWKLTHEQNKYGTPVKLLKGHSHFISDVVMTSDGNHIISSSWDKSMRLWDIKSGDVEKKFIGHSKDVLSVAINKENKFIVSGSRDKSIKIWNSIGENTSNLVENGHTGWVSCVKFSPDSSQIVSSGWDRVVKIWNFKNHKLLTNLIGHQAFINSVTVSPDGSLCASGGKDGVAMLWDLKKGEHLYSLDQESQIHSLAFSPNKYWLCAATDKNIRVWDLEKKETIAELIPESNSNNKKKKEKRPVCVSLAWSHDGTTLFSGYTDNTIRVWSIHTSN